MSRLIDADTFKEYIRKGTEENADIIPKTLVNFVLDIMDGIMLDIDEQPTIDAEPVVRCEHCIYNTRNTDGVAEDWCYKHGIDIAFDDYCSYGEEVDE